MKTEFRTLRSKSESRPNTEVKLDSDLGLSAIITPWGNSASAEEYFRVLSEYILTANNDAEATTPFPILTDLSASANRLRIGNFLANEAIYRKFNSKEYTAGLEVLSIITTGNELSFLHFGSDFAFFLDSKSGKTFPLGGFPSFSARKGRTAPLPSRLLGIEPRIEFSIGSLKFQKGDRLISISRDGLDYLDILQTLSQAGIDSFLEKMDKKEDAPFSVASLIL
jgi:hypothetical protein